MVGDATFRDPCRCVTAHKLRQMIWVIMLRMGTVPCVERHAFKALLSDLDSVIKQSARLHAKIWQELLDEFLRLQASKSGVAN